jgi:hypothetical protein
MFTKKHNITYPKKRILDINLKINLFLIFFPERWGMFIQKYIKLINDIMKIIIENNEMYMIIGSSQKLLEFVKKIMIGIAENNKVSISNKIFLVLFNNAELNIKKGFFN